QTAVKGFAEFIEPIGALDGVELVFCGYADRNLSLDEMAAWYAGIDVYVCASLSEGSNNSLLEAAASGCAIVTTDNGTVPEYLTHGASALIVQRERSAFIDAITTLRDDVALRQQLGQAASAAVLPAWTWAVRAEDHRRFLRDAVQQVEAARTVMATGTPGGRRWVTAVADRLQQAVHAGRIDEAQQSLDLLLSVDPKNAGYLEIRGLLRGSMAA
ncbi:MAG TPA: glycosyltransferase family 4 protein, partial [Gemmatimonadaceae bacterium]|nr:glycosyltransferase family 4 protein [Gemmatimonadaceae bacterium]